MSISQVSSKEVNIDFGQKGLDVLNKENFLNPQSTSSIKVDNNPENKDNETIKNKNLTQQANGNTGPSSKPICPSKPIPARPKNHPHLGDDFPREMLNNALNPKEVNAGKSEKCIEANLKVSGVIDKNGKINFEKLGISKSDIRKNHIKGECWIDDNGKFQVKVTGNIGKGLADAFKALKTHVGVVAKTEGKLENPITLNPEVLRKISPEDRKALDHGGQIKHLSCQPPEGATLKLVLDPGGDDGGLTVETMIGNRKNRVKIPLSAVFEGKEYNGKKMDHPLLADWRDRKLFEDAQVRKEYDCYVFFNKKASDNTGNVERIQAENTLWNAVNEYLNWTLAKGAAKQEETDKNKAVQSSAIETPTTGSAVETKVEAPTGQGGKGGAVNNNAKPNGKINPEKTKDKEVENSTDPSKLEGVDKVDVNPDEEGEFVNSLYKAPENQDDSIRWWNNPLFDLKEAEGIDFSIARAELEGETLHDLANTSFPVNESAEKVGTKGPKGKPQTIHASSVEETELKTPDATNVENPKDQAELDEELDELATYAEYGSYFGAEVLNKSKPLSAFSKKPKPTDYQGLGKSARDFIESMENLGKLPNNDENAAESDTSSLGKTAEEIEPLNATANATDVRTVENNGAKGKSLNILKIKPSSKKTKKSSLQAVLEAAKNVGNSIQGLRNSLTKDANAAESAPSSWEQTEEGEGIEIQNPLYKAKSDEEKSNNLFDTGILKDTITETVFKNVAEFFKNHTKGNQRFILPILNAMQTYQGKFDEFFTDKNNETFNYAIKNKEAFKEFLINPTEETFKAISATNGKRIDPS